MIESYIEYHLTAEQAADLFGKENFTEDFYENRPIKIGNLSEILTELKSDFGQSIFSGKLAVVEKIKSEQEIAAEHAVVKAKEALKAAEEALEKVKLVK